MKKTIFMGLMLSAIASVIMATASTMIPVVKADKGGDPNNSEESQQNAEERHTKKVEKDSEAFSDDNPHNDIGPERAHFNQHQPTGVGCEICG